MTFLVLAIIGIVLLVISVVFDGVLDIFGFDSPFLSGTALSAFLAGFGLTGLLIPDSWGTAGVIAAAVAAGLILAGCTAIGMRAMANTKTDANVSASTVLGVSGTVVSPILGGAYGEVAVTVAGHRMKYNALADEDLRLGTAVTVIHILSPSAVKVAAV